MRRMTPYGVGILWCAVVALVLCTGIARAATCEKWAGKVVSAQGIVEVKPAGETRWQAVKLNETYCPGDTIRTDRKSRADIALYNHPILRLDQNSTVTLGGMKDEKTSLVDMLSGAALFFSRVTRNLEVRTATVNAGVEGTEFFIRVEEGKTDLTVFEGKVLASNAAGALPVATGQSVVAEAGKAPVYRVVVRPRDAVHWALYYPPVLDGRPADLKEESGDPRFYTARASQLLSVGRVDEAIADIDKAQKLDPKNSDAFALRSIIAVTQNEKGKALELAQQAVTADPKSATARIALSYAQQAHYNLKGALGNLEEAVKLAPGNALGWARLAELQQSFGYLDKSLDSAKKAVASNPNLSRTQTVLGFSHLTRVETKEARGAFEKAIKLDDADPLPRLGLGLATIRDGNLEEGRRELEIAMSLDPNSSLIRSYLGKAYYEEKRDKLATGQYEMAKNLDPMDPTPYFYDAIEKQTTNRPAGALHDMQKAIELNDNRMVYRSRLLLDQDLAAREASLARIYNDLGFQQLGLVEGWKSVNTDPSNYSAHRFLADSYAALPRHEIARVSELLQSQLLQPLNITPIQPRLAESSLFVVSAGGPANLSFNEFNPLFERNRLALQADGIVGNKSTWGEEAALAGLYNKISASVGQYHFETDGFRTNNDFKDDIYNAFFQESLSPNTNIQAEYRYRERKNGDIVQNFLRDDLLANRRFENETQTLRFGFHQAFSPGSHLLVSLVGQKLEENISDTPFPDVNIYLKDSEKSYGGEIQYQHSLKSVKLIFGAGYQKTNADSTENDVITIPGFESNDTFFTSNDAEHTNLYLYAYILSLKNFSITVGASGDFFKQENYLDKDQFNPKLGVVWTPTSGTTIRAAAFRTLKRTLMTNQTLEPTQVAGFNQFYDDYDATESRVYGIAADQKFSKSIYGGIEYSYRDLPKVPQIVGTDEVIYNKWNEKLGHAYLYFTPHEWFSLNAEYWNEKFDREGTPKRFQDMKTQRIPMGLNFFHPSGISAMWRTTYIDQEGTFNTKQDEFTFFQGSDNFWVSDAAISYRLPKRYGMVIIGAKNIFNQSFNYLDVDEANPSIQPVRTYYAKINLSF